MKIKQRHGFFLIGMLTCARLLAAEPASNQPKLFQAIRDGDQAILRALIKNDAAVSVRDDAGNTPLHVAALRGEAATVALLLKAGAEVNATNQAGATPLLYGAHNERIVRCLLKSGANPNLASALGSTPLMAAVMCNDSFGAVRSLVEHGADIKARRSWQTATLGGGEQALPLAIAGGDRRIIDFLIKHGASVNPTNSFSPLESAALYGDLPTARRLLELGADPNLTSTNVGRNKAGHALDSALFGDHREMALLLINREADLRHPSKIGHGTTPAVFSAYSETGDDTVARLLKAKDVDLNTPNDAGETAWSWALKRGTNTPLARWLREVGATNAPVSVRAKAVPDRSVPTEPAARRSMAREQAQRAIRALDHSSTVFLASSLAQRQGQCISCHHQSLPEAVFGLARDRGLQLNASDLSRLLGAHVGNWRTSTEAARQLLEPTADAANELGWGLQGLHALGYAPDDLTEAMAHYLLLTQRVDGSWRIFDRRPPIQDSALVGTALAVRGVQLYPIEGRERETTESLKRARRWLAQAKPQTHNERVFQLLGLSWSGEPPAKLGQHMKTLLADQRADGGWAQLPGRECDAWATGQALFALHQAGGLATSHPAYQRGVEFLLRTQFDDGSWWVHSRTWPFQPHFDSQFPHGKDQWISAAGTAWATMALLLTIEPMTPKVEFPSAQQLIASAALKASAPTIRLKDREAGNVLGTVDFNRDIRPIFERSCVACHSGEKPKGEFSLENVAALLKGGQSGEPAVVPGKPDRSPLVRMVADQVEDLEMPPLGKREKFPALTKDEIAKLNGWIAQGANWPQGAKLHAPGK